MRRFGILLLAPVMLLCGMAGAPAHAHAFLDHAEPAVGSTVRASPATVRLRFTEGIEPAFSTIRVLDRQGRQVDKGDQHVGGDDATQMTVSLPPLPAGVYKVVWRVVSVDTHVTEGDFTFTVTPKAVR
jgi:methionine-rich copper-binding protein CopC